MEELRLDNVKVGGNFKGHTVIKKYYYDNEKGFIIFKNEKDDVIFFSQKQVTEISRLLGRCNVMREMVHSKTMKSWIDAQKASALNEYFCEHKEKSEEILIECIEMAEKREVARKRKIYIGTYLGVTIIFLLLILFSNKFEISKTAIKYLYICMFGAFGGFISLNTRLEKIEFRLYEGTLSYILVSIFKLSFSCVSSIIVYFLIESDLILSTFKNSPGIIYIAATLAGFSESLLPNIFSGLEKDIISKDDK